MQTPNARVRRDDKVQDRRGVARSSSGDILELEAGDAVPADARLLQTIEPRRPRRAALTGESVPGRRRTRAPPCADDAPLGDRATMLFIGTSVVRGKGRAVVVATGAAHRARQARRR